MKRAIIVILMVILLVAAVPTDSVQASPGWDYRRPITITNGSGSTLTDYQVEVTLTTAIMGDPYSNVNADGSDLRFTNEDNTVKYDYYIGNWNNTGTSRIWVEVSSIPSGNSTMYMWYGNAAAPSQSDGDNTFAFFDDFEDGTIDTNKWGARAGTWTESAGKLHGTGGEPGYLINKVNIPSNFCIKLKGKTSRGAMMIWAHRSASGDPYAAPYMGYYIRVLGDALRIFYDSANVSSGTYDYSAGTWYYLEARKAGYNLWMRSWDANRNQLQTLSQTATNLPTGRRIAFRPYDETIDVDFIYVRKYVSSEPTNSVGTEQAAGPADPVPELPTIILLSMGLAALGGYFAFRKLQPARKRNNLPS